MGIKKIVVICIIIIVLAVALHIANGTEINNKISNDGHIASSLSTSYSEKTMDVKIIKSVRDNQAPTDPTINGLTSVKVWVENEWTFFSTDSEGDNITYYVDWGDKCGGGTWYGPYTSGEEVILSHRYTFSDKLIINSLAVDEHGSESNMTYFEVTITKSRFANRQFQNLFEQLLNMFPRIRNLLNL